MGRWGCLLALIVGGRGDDTSTSTSAVRPWGEARANGTAAFTTVGP